MLTTEESPLLMDQSIDQILYEQPIDKLAQLRQNLSIMRKKLTQSCNHTQTLKDKTNQLVNQNTEIHSSLIDQEIKVKLNLQSLQTINDHINQTKQAQIQNQIVNNENIQQQSNKYDFLNIEQSYQSQRELLTINRQIEQIYRNSLELVDQQRESNFENFQNLGSYLDMLYNQYYNSLNNALSEELKTEKLAVLDDEKNKTLKANQDLSEVVHEISELYENLKSHHIQPSSQNTNGAVGVVANNISNQNQLESNDNSYNSDPYFEMHTKAKFILKNTQREVEDLKSEIQVLKEKIQAKRFNNQ